MRPSTLIIIALLVCNLLLLYWLDGRHTDLPQQASGVSPALSGNWPDAGVQTPRIPSTDSLQTTTTGSPEPRPAETGDIDYGMIVADIDDITVRYRELLPYLYDTLPEERLAVLNDPFAIDEPEWLRAVEQFALDLATNRLAAQTGLLQQASLQASIQYSRRQLIRHAYLQHTAARQVSDEKLRQHYEELAASMQNQSEYHIRHILLTSEKEANLLYRALKAKKRSFDELAKVFSLDDATAYRGGDLGYRLAYQLPPDFAEQIIVLKPGKYSKPFKTAQGWHIAELIDRRPARILPYEQVAGQLKKALLQKQASLHAISLLKQADIQLFVSEDQGP